MKFLGKMSLYAVAVVATMFVGTVSACEETEWMNQRTQEGVHALGSVTGQIKRAGEDAVPGKGLGETLKGYEETFSTFVTKNIFTPAFKYIYNPYVVPAKNKVAGNAGSIVAFAINDKSKGSDLQKAVVYSFFEVVDNFAIAGVEDGFARGRDWKQHLGHAVTNYVIVKLNDALKQIPNRAVNTASKVLPKGLCKLAARVVVSPIAVKTLVATGIYYCGGAQGRAFLNRAGYGRVEYVS